MPVLKKTKQILLRRRTGPAQPSPAPAQLSSGLRVPEPPSPRPLALSSARTLPRPATDRWDPPVGFVTDLPPESSTRTIRRPTPCSTRAPPPSSPLVQGDPLYKPRPWPRFASNRSSPRPARTRRTSRDPPSSPRCSDSEAERPHRHRLPLVEPRLSIFSTGAAKPRSHRPVRAAATAAFFSDADDVTAAIKPPVTSTVRS